MARGALVGLVPAVPLAVVLAGQGFPQWGQDVTDIVLAFMVLLPLGLAFRLVLHGVQAYVHSHEAWPSREEREEEMLRYARPVIAAGTAAVVLWLVLTVTGAYTAEV
jgi:hypothetical protein